MSEITSESPTDDTTTFVPVPPRLCSISPHAEPLPPHAYPGLRPFRRSESAIFFGRGTQVADALTRLEDQRFLTIVGASGCGKSSLVQAGLLPALEQGFLATTTDQWRFIVMRPGQAPMRNLARELRCGLGTPPMADERDSHGVAYLQAVLRSGPRALVQVVDDAGLPPDTNVLILVDQFEELFRFRQCSPSRDGTATAEILAAQRGEAAALVSLLLATVASQERPIYVVLTMRSDFLGDCDAFFGLPEAISKSQFLTPRLTREQARDAIVGPARLFGGEVEPALVNHILNEIGDDPDQLPLMQHALMRCWEVANPENTGDSADTPRTLTLEQYTRVGGIAKALDRHAEETYGQFADVSVDPKSNDAVTPSSEHFAQFVKWLVDFTLYWSPNMRQMFEETARERPGDFDLAELEIAKLPRLLRDLYQAMLLDLRKRFQVPSAPPQSRRQRICERMFRCLSEVRYDGHVVRRLATIQEIAEVADVEVQEVMDVADRFLRSECSLLTVSPPGRLAPETTLDVSHEVLLRQWGRLKRWIRAEQESADIFRRLATTTHLWSAKLASRWRDADLRPVERWQRVDKPTAAWAKRYARVDGSQATFEESLKFLQYSRRWDRIWALIGLGVFAVICSAIFIWFEIFIGQFLDY